MNLPWVLRTKTQYMAKCLMPWMKPESLADHPADRLLQYKLIFVWYHWVVILAAPFANPQTFVGSLALNQHTAESPGMAWLPTHLLLTRLAFLEKILAMSRSSWR